MRGKRGWEDPNLGLWVVCGSQKRGSWSSPSNRRANLSARRTAQRGLARVRGKYGFTCTAGASPRSSRSNLITARKGRRSDA